MRVDLEGEPWLLVSAFLDDPRTWLPEPAEPAGDGSWTVAMRCGPTLLRASVRVGPPWSLPDLHARHLTWMLDDPAVDPAAAARLLPEFAGQLALRPCERWGAQLELSGHERAHVGAPLEDTTFARLGHSAAAVFLADVGRVLAARAADVGRGVRV